jgi:predicted Zn-dependent protease with MMP-like domain
MPRTQGYADTSFEELVVEALAELPPEIREWLDNVAVVVEDRPSPALLREMGVPPGQTLFGLYQGIPLTERTTGYNLVAPDKITIFREPIEAYSRSPEEVRELVKHVVVHELAHHFGIDDERLWELGAY